MTSIVGSKDYGVAASPIRLPSGSMNCPTTSPVGDRQRLTDKIGTLPRGDMLAVDDGLRLTLHL